MKKGYSYKKTVQKDQYRTPKQDGSHEEQYTSTPSTKLKG